MPRERGVAPPLPHLIGCFLLGPAPKAGSWKPCTFELLRPGGRSLTSQRTRPDVTSGGGDGSVPVRSLGHVQSEQLVGGSGRHLEPVGSARAGLAG